MKTLIKTLFFGILFMVPSLNLAQNIEHVMCTEYWAQVPFQNICALNASYFDFEGQNDICKAKSNDSYPYDENISILVYNNFDAAGAREEFEISREDLETHPEYMTVDDLGDEAFALLRVEFGRLDSVIIEVLKGNLTIQLDINGNSANDSNNCLTPSSVFEFARIIVDQM